MRLALLVGALGLAACTCRGNPNTLRINLDGGLPDGADTDAACAEICKVSYPNYLESCYVPFPNAVVCTVNAPCE
jgi:hypothetical protein